MHSWWTPQWSRDCGEKSVDTNTNTLVINVKCLRIIPPYRVQTLLHCSHGFISVLGFKSYLFGLPSPCLCLKRRKVCRIPCNIQGGNKNTGVNMPETNQEPELHRIISFIGRSQPQRCSLPPLQVCTLTQTEVLYLTIFFFFCTTGPTKQLSNGIRRVWASSRD